MVRFSLLTETAVLTTLQDCANAVRMGVYLVGALF
jgi:hypothetical protein